MPVSSASRPRHTDTSTLCPLLRAVQTVCIKSSACPTPPHSLTEPARVTQLVKRDIKPAQNEENHLGICTSHRSDCLDYPDMEVLPLSGGGGHPRPDRSHRGGLPGLPVHGVIPCERWELLLPHPRPPCPRLLLHKTK